VPEFRASFNGKVLHLAMVSEHMRLAVKADIDNLFRKTPHPDTLRSQLRAMITAEARAERYGVTVPWREKEWYGITVPRTIDDVDKSAILNPSPTGRKAGRQKEKKN